MVMAVLLQEGAASTDLPSSHSLATVLGTPSSSELAQVRRASLPVVSLPAATNTVMSQRQKANH